MLACVVVCVAQWRRTGTNLHVDGAAVHYVQGKRAILKSLHDTQTLDVLLEDPDLYYEDDTGRWIWAAESTAPRDALSRLVIHAWLHIVVEDEMIDTCILSFHEYLSSYVSQGIELSRVIVDIRLIKEKQVNKTSLASLIAMVEHVGAEHTISSVFQLSSHPYSSNISSWNDSHSHSFLLASLLSLDGIPLHDWIISVMFGQLAHFGDTIGSIDELMEGNERNGASYAATSVASSNEENSFVVAMKGYLRSHANSSHVFDQDGAEEYFGDAFEYMFTPYYTWWEFYKSNKVVGNAYLWYARLSDISNISATSMLQDFGSYS